MLDRKRSSYCAPTGVAFEPSFPALDVDLVQDRRALASVCERYLEHHLDILGSGWVFVGREARPTVNRANRDHAHAIASLVSPDYAPIDWDTDVKSGHSWPVTTWSPQIQYGDVGGVDVKVPWELARMHHLPQLALAYAAAAAGDDLFLPPDRYLREICDEILDFAAASPPRFGVNWACAMDVGIRASNWIVAIQLLLGAGAALPASFLDFFTATLVDHGRFICRFLEWSPDLRSNHYLADVVGLAFIGATLTGAEPDRWLGFAARELVAETEEQFLPDGSNFEASTSYHRLSTELSVFGTAAILGTGEARLRRAVEASADWTPGVPGRTAPPPRPAKPLQGAHSARLLAAGRFVESITRPDGDIPQFGDNDSGRLLKLSPVWSLLEGVTARRLFANLSDVVVGAEYWYEHGLDHRHLSAAIGSLLGCPVSDRRHAIDAWVVSALADGRTLTTTEGSAAPPPKPTARPTAAANVRTTRIRVGSAARSHRSYELRVHDDFGVYVLRSGDLYVALRCGAVGQAGNGGHAHNDPLTVEAVVDGVDWLVDPGTYVYTPEPAERDRYRAGGAHNGPLRDDVHLGRLSLGLFRLGDDFRTRLVSADPHCVAARVEGRHGVAAERAVLIEDGEIVIVDSVELARFMSGAAVVDTPAAARAALGGNVPVSPGYGWVVHSEAVDVWRREVHQGVRRASGS